MLHHRVMKSSKSNRLLKPVEERRRSSVGSVHDGLADAGLPTSPAGQPLDIRQLFRLRASWKVVQRNVEPVATNLFVSFFRLHPECLQHYPMWHAMCAAVSSDNLADVEVDGLEKKLNRLRLDEDFKNQSTKFLQYVDDVVLHLDDTQALRNAIRSIACYHRKLCSAPPDSVLKMQQPFLSAMKAALEDRFNSDLEEIYVEFVHFMLAEIAQKLATSARTPTRTPTHDAATATATATARIAPASSLACSSNSNNRRGSAIPQLGGFPKTDD